MAAQAPAPSRWQRELPLNRFEASRSTQTDAAGFYHMPTGIGDDYFDGTDPLARVRRHVRLAKQVGARYLRCAFSWNGIEPEQGVYKWEFWDRLVAEAERAGIQLIPYVGYTPEWAATDEHEFWKKPPRDSKLYADFMHTLAARYRGRIKSWEIWNEPDIPEYWQGTVDEFARLVKDAAVAIRHADPKAVLVLAGMSKGPGEFFRELMERHHIDRWVDVIAMHGYPESWYAERLETVYGPWIREYAQLIERGRGGVDYWLNESGYPDYRFSPKHASKWKIPAYYRHEHTSEYAAVALFRTYVMALASEAVSLTSWYRIDDFAYSEKRLGDDRVHFHLGVVDARGRPKTTYYALRFFNRLFDQPTRRSKVSAEDPRSQAVVNVIEKKDGTVVVAGWLRSSEGDEVQAHTGMLVDGRREVHAIPLPCQRVSGLRSYDARGRPTEARVQFRGGRLEKVPLTGDRVFVAEMRCVRGDNAAPN